jgi:hypothetical protein
MKPTKFFIKNILKGDYKAKVIPDTNFYGELVSVNDKLLKRVEDNFVEDQIKIRMEELRNERIRLNPL